MAETSGICSLCLKGTVKYTCPRCNIRYCSSECYKGASHGQCSEAFYRDCFMQGLQEMESSSDEKRKMMDMLKRLDDEQVEEEFDSDDDDDDLEDRIAGLDLDKDTDKLWEKLTDREKREFEEMVKDGRMANLVEMYNPWWLKKADLVQEIGTEKESLDPSKQCGVVPSPLSSIPDFDTMFKKQPSNDIQCNTVNILYGYCFIVRLYDGEFYSTSCALEMTKISEVLLGKSFSEPASALHACLHNLQTSAKDHSVSQEFSIGIVQDVLCILNGPSKQNTVDYVISALSDVYNVFKKAKKSIISKLKSLTKDAPEFGQLSCEKQKCFTVCKKMEFYLSWVVKYGEVLEGMIPVLDVEFCTLTTNLDKHQNDVDKLEGAWGGKRPPRKMKFIEEIN